MRSYVFGPVHSHIIQPHPLQRSSACRTSDNDYESREALCFLGISTHTQVDARKDESAFIYDHRSNVEVLRWHMTSEESSLLNQFAAAEWLMTLNLSDKMQCG